MIMCKICKCTSFEELGIRMWKLIIIFFNFIVRFGPPIVVYFKTLWTISVNTRKDLNFYYNIKMFDYIKLYCIVCVWIRYDKNRSEIKGSCKTLKGDLIKFILHICIIIITIVNINWIVILYYNFIL